MKISLEPNIPTFYPAHTLTNLGLWTWSLSKEIGLTWDVFQLRAQVVGPEV